MSIRLPSAAIAALLASTLLLTGCNDDGDEKGDSTSAADPSQSTSQSSDPGSEGSEGSGSDIAPLEADNFYKSVLEAQKEAGTFKGTVTTTTGGASVVMNMEGKYSDGTTAAHVQSTPDSAQQMETILVDGVMYLRGEGLNVPDGKWLKFDFSDPANANDPMSSLMDLSDPERALAAMDNPKKFELIGAESVEGVDTNHYQITMDSATYGENLDLPQEIVTILPKVIVYDMWVDAENRPIKVSQEFDVQGTQTSTEQTYSDYGSDVDIVAPDDADTITR